ncbi:hypothetical protein BDN72DRAFT_778495 [Pluteus cervinus]|uniref:Uncharacterized protein n=1 Tax=Pluteus cervinus TaxID=181527 RepID=A0ACD3A6A1_9AGAR|nr:hypothetical protein BDN72DRAFT_778495 [Pluteus cervinus]
MTFHASLKGIKSNFRNSVISSTSFNLEPSAVSIDHTDGNVGYGLCALASLGSFDRRKSGYLVLFDMGILLEFDSGSIAFLPSGILQHGNTTLQDGEERYSIT